jgi:hypothetical protein
MASARFWNELAKYCVQHVETEIRNIGMFLAPWPELFNPLLLQLIQPASIGMLIEKARTTLETNRGQGSVWAAQRGRQWRVVHVRFGLSVCI